jgi:hypothetical protein
MCLDGNQERYTKSSVAIAIIFMVSIVITSSSSCVLYAWETLTLVEISTITLMHHGLLCNKK